MRRGVPEDVAGGFCAQTSELNAMIATAGIVRMIAPSTVSWRMLNAHFAATL
jgi:hypothetical protein